MASGRTHVALLRGINVGGKNKLPMKELAALFAAEGCESVETYIQSGNVLFSLPPTRAKGLSARIPAAIRRRFGFEVPVVIRSGEELTTVPDRNPFLAHSVASGHAAGLAALHVAFLAEAPGEAERVSLDPGRSPPDAFAVVGREVYLHLPNGVARTKLTNAYLDRQLRTVSTLRNWNTVLKLIELMEIRSK